MTRTPCRTALDRGIELRILFSLAVGIPWVVRFWMRRRGMLYNGVIVSGLSSCWTAPPKVEPALRSVRASVAAHGNGTCQQQQHRNRPRLSRSHRHTFSKELCSTKKVSHDSARQRLVRLQTRNLQLVAYLRPRVIDRVGRQFQNTRRFE
jgi:hypothetical protein